MRYLPGRKEMLIFAVLAVVCAAIVWAMPSSRDLATSATAFPVFIGISVFSLWKHGRLGGGTEPTED
jgi:hypothetical protein